MSPLARAAIGLVKAYQAILSPLLPPSCRYAPSCSAYMIEAVRRFGVTRGIYLGTARLLRCHPFGGSGHDPVPETFSRPACCRRKSI